MRREGWWHRKEEESRGREWRWTAWGIKVYEGRGWLKVMWWERSHETHNMGNWLQATNVMDRTTSVGKEIETTKEIMIPDSRGSSIRFWSEIRLAIMLFSASSPTFSILSASSSFSFWIWSPSLHLLHWYSFIPMKQLWVVISSSRFPGSLFFLVAERLISSEDWKAESHADHRWKFRTSIFLHPVIEGYPMCYTQREALSRNFSEINKVLWSRRLHCIRVFLL